jgi:hypothetical protein
MLNRYQTISLDDVRERTKMQLRLQNTTEHDDFIDVLVLEGLRNLNNLYQLKKSVCELDVEDNKAKLPKGFVRLIALAFTDEGGTNSSGCSPILYADTRFLSSCGCEAEDGVYNYLETFQINKNYIHFRSDIGTDKVRLAYYSLITDDYGNLVIYEDFERGLQAYACWNFMMAYYEDYPMNLTDMHRKTWVAQKAYLKGSAQAEDFQRNKREIQNIFKSKLVSNLLNI